MSELIKFNLSDALNGAPVQTRDGRKVSNVKKVCEDVIFDDGVDSTYQQGLVAGIHNDHGLCTYPFYTNGGSHKYLGENAADLFMVKI